MSANSLSDSSAAKSRSDKGGKPSLTVTLRLPSARLLPFADKSTMRKTTKGRSSLAAVADTVEATPATSTPASPAENGADASASPANPETKEVVDSDAKKSTPGPKAGTKRGLGPDGLPKPRGKPGPKRRKLDDGETNGTTPVAAHKLGPKANQGAINAGLRALDRSGKPCRRWEKKPMIIKSFTGVTWPLHSWGSQARLKPELPNGDSEKSSSVGGQENGQVNGKDGIASSSAVESEKSNSGDPAGMNASSPPAMDAVATPTAVMAEG